MQTLNFKDIINLAIELELNGKIFYEELAEKFDIRAFHDTILGGGAMPLTILERRVREWVEVNK